MPRSYKQVGREEWFACRASGEMMIWLRTASGRKLRLFACATCRQVWEKMSDGGRELVLAAERWADGEINRNELNAIRAHHEPLLPRSQFGVMSEADRAALATATPRKDALGDLIRDVAVGAAGVYDGDGLRKAHDRHCLLFHDVFDVLFLDVTVGASWRSAAALAVATTIYRDRAFDQMPVLADALLDAGCDSEDVLSHCRNGLEHARGCWVLDLLLGKE
jgi:hypothetical protein